MNVSFSAIIQFFCVPLNVLVRTPGWDSLLETRCNGPSVPFPHTPVSFLSIRATSPPKLI